MNQKVTFDPPRWPGGPPICLYANLPAFVDQAAVKTFLARTLGDSLLTWLCKDCGHYHMWPKPHAPAGESSGSARVYNIPRRIYELAGLKEPGYEGPVVHTLSEEDKVNTVKSAKENFARCRESGSQHAEEWNTKTGGFEHTEANEISCKGAETAVCRVLGVEPTFRVMTPDPEGDVLKGVQVRQTKYVDGHLRIHKRDADGHQFFLVTGRFPTYAVVGWAWGKEGKRDEWWDKIKDKNGNIKPLNTKRPCYMMPQDQVRPVSTWPGPPKL